MRHLSSAVLTVGLCLISARCTLAQAAPALRDRMHQAETETSLDNAAMTPWHLKAVLQLMDAKGQIEQEGTYEEWWMAADRYRTTYDFPGNKVTELHNEHGAFRTREEGVVPARARELAEGIIHPMPAASDFLGSTPELRKQDFNKTQYDCIMLSKPLLHTAFAPLGLFPTYCFLPDTHTLVAAFLEAGETLARTRMGTFQMKNVGVSLSLSLNGVILGKASLTELKTSNEVAPHLQDDPALEAITGKPTPVPGVVIAGKLIKKVDPVYPESAKHERITGAVQLHCIIGRDGHIRSLHFLSAPSADMAIASLIAVRQ